MKKKSSSVLQPAKVKEHSRGAHPYFCEVAATETAALGGIALRVIMSDIRKHKLTRENAPEKTVPGSQKVKIPKNE